MYRSGLSNVHKSSYVINGFIWLEHNEIISQVLILRSLVTCYVINVFVDKLAVHKNMITPWHNNICHAKRAYYVQQVLNWINTT